MYKDCLFCGKRFKKNKKYSKSQWEETKNCSRSCGGKSKEVTPAMIEHLTKIATGRKQSEDTKVKRGIYKSGADHYLWKGGVSLNDNGYLRNNRSRAYEHREVAERHLGRKLRHDEHVHHLNHDKTDNRIENLLVLTNEWHSRIHGNLDGNRPWENKVAKQWKEAIDA